MEYKPNKKESFSSYFLFSVSTMNTEYSWKWCKQNCFVTSRHTNDNYNHQIKEVENNIGQVCNKFMLSHRHAICVQCIIISICILLANSGSAQEQINGKPSKISSSQGTDTFGFCTVCFANAVGRQETWVHTHTHTHTLAAVSYLDHKFSCGYTYTTYCWSR